MFTPELKAIRYRLSKRFATADYLRASVAVLQVAMETSDERRKRRLASLCEQHGGVRAVAELSGVAWATLDQILKGTLLPAKGDGTRSPRALGDANARAIEDAMDLGRGWFDWPFDAVDFKSYDALNDTQRGYVQAHMVAAIKECSAKQAKPKHALRAVDTNADAPTVGQHHSMSKPVAKKSARKRSA